MKKIMTFKEFADLAVAAKDKNMSNVSYYDPTKGWVLTFESKRSKKEEAETTAC